MKCGIDINAEFYRGHLIDDRKLTPHVAELATLVGLWSLIYLVGASCQWRSRTARLQRNGPTSRPDTWRLDAETGAAELRRRLIPPCDRK